MCSVSLVGWPQATLAWGPRVVGRCPEVASQIVAAKRFSGHPVRQAAAARSGAGAGLPAGLLEIGQAAAGAAQGVVACFTHVAEGRPMAAALRDGRNRNNEGGTGAHGFLLDARSHDRFNSITFY